MYVCHSLLFENYMAAMTSSKQHIKNWKKMSSQIFDKIIWSKFHQNRPYSFQIKGCDRHTYIHTYTHTHTYIRTYRAPTQQPPQGDVTTDSKKEHKDEETA